MPYVSLIVSTKGRKREIRKLLSSLEAQSFTDFEVVVVDQNDTDPLHTTLSGTPLDIRYFHTPDVNGVSRGRNYGLAQVSSPIVIFPDDDCWYPPDFLENSVEIMDRLGLDALTGRPTDEDGNPIQGRFEKERQTIDRRNVWTTQIEWLAVWRRQIVNRVGGFDEMVGVGAETPWQSAEGQELMLRVLAAGGKAVYDPSITGHDAGVDPESADADLRRKMRAYGRGMGYVVRQHRLGFGTAAKFVSRSLAGALLAGLRGKASLCGYYLSTGLGRIEGLTGRCLGSASRK